MRPERETDGDPPYGRLLDRRRIGQFVFVRHDYPEPVEGVRHAHPWLHLTMVCRGGYRRRVGTRTADYSAGSLSLIRTEDSHADFYPAGSRCLHVVVPSEVEAKLARTIGADCRTAQLPPGLSARFLTALQREFDRADDESPVIVEALLLDLISRHIHVNLERSSARPRWLGLLLDYVDDTFEQRWSLETIAAEIGVHPVHLCRTFSEHLGCTLGEYIRGQRLMRGWQLLALSRATLAQVAHQSGFCDQSHFTRAFKHRFGIAPGRWRRRWAENRRNRRS